MPIQATCTLHNLKHKIVGTVSFTEHGKNTIIDINLSGLKPFSKHGIHIHESGDLRNGCTSLCAHYNPFNALHGGPNDDKEHRHVGDLGNVQADRKGLVNHRIYDSLIKLKGKYSILGRSVILHEDEDDLGLGHFEDSYQTGHSGKRIACGIIGYASLCH